MQYSGSYTQRPRILYKETLEKKRKLINLSIDIPMLITLEQPLTQLYSC